MFPMIRRSMVRDPFDALDREFGRLARRLFSEDEPNNANGGMTASYPVDIREDETAFHVEAELPGFRKEEVDITLENGVLTITAVRQAENKEEQKGQLHLNERRYTRVVRSFNLPNTLDENSVDATLDSGVLKLTIQKREEVKPRKIEVK